LEVLHLVQLELPIGPVEQLNFERELADRDRPQVLAQLARDASMIRACVDTIAKLSASGPAMGETVDPLGPRSKTLPPLANLAVHISGEQPFPARWTVKPAESSTRLRVTAEGSQGRAVYTEEDGLAPRATLKYTVSGSQDAQVMEFPGSFGVDTVLGIVSDRLRGREHPQKWLDACRDVEVATSVDRSLERGRAVEFFGEEHTEEQSFKGIMAVGGCLMLSVTVVALLVAAAVEGLKLPLRESALWKAWPMYVLVPIVLFLLLQVLQGVARRPAKPAEGERQQNLPAG
jgi:hypothetical protein